MLSEEFIYNRIRSEIKKKGYSKQRFCLKAGIRVSTLDSWKTRYPSFLFFLIVAETLGITPSELLMDDYHEWLK